MKKWIEDLMQLQENDLRQRQLRQRLEMLPHEVARIEEALAEDRKTIDSAKNQVMQAELDIKQVESEIAKQNEHITKLQNQSTMIKKNEEYRALMKEVEHCRKQISDFETQELILMEKLETARNAQRNTAQELKEKEKTAQEEEAELKELASRLKQEIQRLQEARVGLAEIVDQEILPHYERLLGKGIGSPLVKVEKGNCGNCNIKLTPQSANQARKGLQIACENCGHLLYTED